MKSNKLILAFLLGVITLNVAAASAAFAWYATSRTLYINSIDIGIDADRDLKISTSRDSGYTDHVTQTEEEAKGIFAPLTSAHSSEWMSLKKDMPVFYDETRFSKQENVKLYEAASSGYFSKKFYLKADDDVYVTLDADNTYINKNKEWNEYYAAYLYEEYKASGEEYYKDLEIPELEERLNRIINAMRFSILINDGDDYRYIIIDPHKKGITKLGGVLDNDADKYFDYYQVGNTDEYKERVYGEIIATPEQYDYSDPLDDDIELDTGDAPSAFNAGHKKGIRKFNLEESEAKGLVIKEEESIDLKDFKKDVKPFHFPVYADTPKEVVISIYIEGWDLESVNYTMGAAFLANLSFTIEREM